MLFAEILEYFQKTAISGKQCPWMLYVYVYYIYIYVYQYRYLVLPQPLPWGFIHSSRASNFHPPHQQLSSAHSSLIAKPSLATLLLLIWKKSFTSWQVVGNPIISDRVYIGPGWLFGVCGPSAVWWLVHGYFFFQNRTTIRMDLRPRSVHGLAGV